MSQVFTNNVNGASSGDPQQARVPLTEERGQPSHHEISPRHVSIAILGTGFSGLGMAMKLKQQGYDDFIIIERAADVGGTWRDNTYPGCACDIPSHLYSFSFAPNAQWSHFYSPQPEIWDYLRRCAEEFGLLPHIQWNTELHGASWSDAEACWHLTTSQGPLVADILILGQGPLNEPSLPAIPGLEDFEGVVFHSSLWNHDYDLAGKRIAVIGTGASAIQFVPQIQSKAGQLFLFQRTPPWIVPRLDHPIPAWKQRLFRLLPFTRQLVRARIYARQEMTALALVYRPKLLEQGMRVAREHLEKQVPDPVLREKLTPHYRMGCKRILVSDDFYPAVCQSNVELITESIREVRARSIVTADGVEREIDAIICGTGFHILNTRLPQSVYGRGEQSLAEIWQDYPRSYLGTTVSGFPNLFLLIGPNTGLGHNSMVYMIESQVAYILDCLRTMERRNLQMVEVRTEEEMVFADEMQRRMQGTTWTSGCTSWYLDAQGRNATLWPGFTFEFRRRTRKFSLKPYRVTPRREPMPKGRRFRAPRPRSQPISERTSTSEGKFVESSRS